MSDIDPFDVGMITERLPAIDELWEDGIEPEDEDELPSVIVNLDEAA